MRSFEERLRDGDVSEEELKNYYGEKDAIIESDFISSKEKKKQDRVFGMTSFFRGNGFKYKSKRKGR